MLMSPKGIPPVDNGHALSNGFQMQGPIDRRISATADDHPLTSELIQLVDTVKEILVSIVCFPLKTQGPRSEGSIATGNDDSPRPVLILVGRNSEDAIGLLKAENLLLEADFRRILEAVQLL